MGFPVPVNEWLSGPLQTFFRDTFASQRARRRPFFNSDAIMAHLKTTGRYSRKTWGLLSLELWHQRFHDRAVEYRRMIDASQPI